VIVNADDLGYSSAVNRAVVESMVDGLCTHATIMANMPGFEEACELVHSNGLADRVGVHLVLTEGVPLTADLKRCRRFCDPDGRFCLARSKRIMFLERGEREAIRKELDGQIARCRAEGLNPEHADSHRHAHEEWAIATEVIGICRSDGIRWLRLARNIGRSTGVLRAAYRRMVNYRISRAGLARAEYFGSWEDWEFAIRQGIRPVGEIEIMVHPQYVENEILVDATCGKNLAEILEAAVSG